ISFFKSFLLIGLMFGAYSTSDVTRVKITCNELGLSFILPAAFTTLDSLQMDALSKRGEKAVNETFNKKTLQGWQPACLNLQDSFKRMVLITVIPVKEAIAQDGTVDKFIDKTFKDGNDFLIQRIKSRLNIDIDENETAKQTEITIAGFKVRKNSFTLINGARLLFFSRYYFFQKNGKLFLLSFLGSPKANDNEEIVNAIESAKTI
ncbi:MAG: hypothetical protein ABL872_14965, partial [Lacibacter sp.]